MSAQKPVQFVDLDAARAARGLRIVVVAGVPSPWSEAAKGIFTVKGLDFVAVRKRPGDAELERWTGCNNSPVVMFDDEPARSGWADILALGERLGGATSLLPEAIADRAMILGLCHEILGESGLVWSGRLLLIHSGLTSEGRAGFALPVAQYLAPRYGYAPDRTTHARQRVLAILGHLGGLARAARDAGSRYLVGDGLSAVDIYLASALNTLAPLPHDLCPMRPALRAAFESVEPELRAAVTPELLEHRDFIYREHLGLPMEL
jgi:glutathione S-transferase